MAREMGARSHNAGCVEAVRGELSVTEGAVQSHSPVRPLLHLRITDRRGTHGPRVEWCRLQNKTAGSAPDLSAARSIRAHQAPCPETPTPDAISRRTAEPGRPSAVLELHA